MLEDGIDKSNTSHNAKMNSNVFFWTIVEFVFQMLGFLVSRILFVSFFFKILGLFSHSLKNQRSFFDLSDGP